ncbi:MAG: hypothetical protein RLO04_04735 [Limnobacter sp.]|jgi:hypothetical protein|uniref:hypothetical protein n=1 Tax=Limnobacter sp. TaxID=2003368 RepID=UPI0032ED4E3E
MNLQEFVKASLTQIINGVREAQTTIRLPDKLLSEADLVNPSVVCSADHAPKGKYFTTRDRNLVHFVSFDVAVTIDSSSEAKGSLSIKVAGIGFDADKGGVSKDTIVSRIKFEVPISFPQSSEN